MPLASAHVEFAQPQEFEHFFIAFWNERLDEEHYNAVQDFELEERNQQLDL